MEKQYNEQYTRCKNNLPRKQGYTAKPFILLQKDANYCEAIVTSESGAKRKLNINVDLSNYYTKSQTYTKNDVDALFTQTYNYIDNSIVNYNNTIQLKFLDYYTKIEINSQFLNYYTKTELDTALATKQDNLGYTPENAANKSDSYTASSSTTYVSSKALVDGLSTKLDKGEYTGNAQDLKYEIDSKANISHTHDISNINGLQTILNNKQDRLQNVTGNIGVGKTDASATEKLDVNGRVKSKGQVFEEDSATILR